MPFDRSINWRNDAQEFSLRYTDIIESLEGADVNLEESKDKYSRMLQLNDHIRDEFMKKTKEIKKYHFTTKNLFFFKYCP